MLGGKLKKNEANGTMIIFVAVTVMKTMKSIV